MNFFQDYEMPSPDPCESDEQISNPTSNDIQINESAATEEYKSSKESLPKPR